MSAGLPAGVVTFVFTDIEGSTRMLRDLGDAYAPLLDRHRELLGEAWQAYDGHIVKTEGDACFVAFGDAESAVRACADGQRRLAAEPWRGNVVPRVRMGVHTGVAYPRGDDYVAYAVHQAARVVSAAHGGQVLCTAETIAEVEVGPDLSPVLLGRYRLRDFDRPVPLYQITGDGLAQSFPAVRAIPSEGHNLVVPRSAFVGRASEFEALDRMVRAGHVVSIVGPGGVGKTRLVTEWGLRAASQWRDGLWFVDLSPVADGALIPGLIADAVGLSTGQGADAWVDVLEHLAARSLALILDNSEHLVEEVARGTDRILAACPGVAIVSTSREPLGLSGERQWRLAPLDIETDARQLFLDRATAARHDFRQPPDGDPTLDAICRRLDGLPLALELAAATVAVLTPAEILAGLDDQTRSPRARDHALPERQRTMAALLDWSWDLLDDAQRDCFTALSVFAAGFDLRTAAVAAGRDADDLDVAAIVWALVDKSLVVAELGANRTRYRMLETIRTYARHRLGDTRTRAVAAALAEYFLARFGPQHDLDTAELGQLGEEIENLRALVSLVGAGDQEQAQRLVCTLMLYTSRRKPAAALDVGLASLRVLPLETPARTALLSLVGAATNDVGNPKQALRYLDEARMLREKVGEPPWNEMAIEQNLGVAALIDNRLDDAAAIGEAALESLNQPCGQCRIYNLLALVHGARGDLDAARIWAERGLDVDLERGAIEAAMIDHGNLAEIASLLGDPQGAAAHQRRTLAIALEIGNEIFVAYSFILGARLAGADGRYEDAVRLHAWADDLLARSGQSLYPQDQMRSDELLEKAREHLGSDGYDYECAAGRALPFAEIVASAQNLLSVFSDSAAPESSNA